MSAPEIPAPERPSAPNTASGWSEPASLLDLHWGSYRPRLLIGLTLIAAGTGFVLMTSAYSLPLLLLGSLMQPTGWAILPSTIGRRVAVVVPAIGFTWLMLGGSGFAWCFAVLLTAWLLVRLRPLLSYSVLVLPIVSSVILAATVPDYSVAWVSILVSTLVIVASAWLARWAAIAVGSRQSVRTLRK
ncbi:hypothetical protein [Leifsonia poae]|uniref:hypothetical protein n=1 Tax=Leifsonia poae TaxID=110933 RepID=UPI003D6780B5